MFTKILKHQNYRWNWYLILYIQQHAVITLCNNLFIILTRIYETLSIKQI